MKLCRPAKGTDWAILRSGVGAQRLEFTVDEEALREPQTPEALKFWKRKLRDIDFDWFVSSRLRKNGSFSVDYIVG